ncbi:hypothetical protein C8R43DRAFT_961358 [Mycena crocata]|nr:hypothetical protein C8R43DRAFT_961358 [Mycena crocata]
MSRARPEARKPAKPGPRSPSQAGPDSGLERAWGLGFKSSRPEPGLEARACATKNPLASPGPGQASGLQALFGASGLGLQFSSPSRLRPGPSPGFQAEPGPGHH